MLVKWFSIYSYYHKKYYRQTNKLAKLLNKKNKPIFKKQTCGNFSAKCRFGCSRFFFVTAEAKKQTNNSFINILQGNLISPSLLKGKYLFRKTSACLHIFSFSACFSCRAQLSIKCRLQQPQIVAVKVLTIGCCELSFWNNPNTSSVTINEAAVRWWSVEHLLWKSRKTHSKITVKQSFFW